MSTDGTPAARNGRWSSSIFVDSAMKESSRLLALRLRPDQIGQPRRRIGVAADVEIAVADHVDQHQCLQRRQRAVALGEVDVVAAAVGVVGAVPVGQARLLAIEKEQLDGQRVFPRLQHARQLEQKRGARPPVAGADEAELAVQFGVVVAGEDDPLLPRPGNRGDQVDHPDLVERRLLVPRLLGGGQPGGSSCSLMYLRVCSIAVDPDGRGPRATSCRRCSHARPASNFSEPWAGPPSRAARRDAPPLRRAAGLSGRGDRQRSHQAGRESARFFRGM